jgi:hypothetical protein
VAPLPLRSRLAGLLRRAAAALDSAGTSSGPAGPGAVRASGEPPEHWLQMVRARAPRLLAGGGIGAGPLRGERGRAADPAQLRWPPEPPAAPRIGPAFPDPPSPSRPTRGAFPVPWRARSASAGVARPGHRAPARPSAAVPPRPGVPDGPPPRASAARPATDAGAPRRAVVARHIAVPDRPGSLAVAASPPVPHPAEPPRVAYPTDPARRPSTVDFPVAGARAPGPVPSGTPRGARRAVAARWPDAPGPAHPAAPAWPRLPEQRDPGPVWPHPDPDPSRWPALPDDSPLWTVPDPSMGDRHRAGLDAEQAGR